MALVIVNRQAPEGGEIIRLRNNLRSAQEAAEYLNEIQANATDDDLQTVFGIPSVSGTQFRSVVSNLVTALQAAAVDNFISNLG